MAAASCVLTEDQFLCPICLDVFTHPVTTPCGHNFCKKCIMRHWGDIVPCTCPMCKKLFYSQPECQVNTFVAEMVSQFRKSANQEPCSSSSSSSSSSTEQHGAKPEDVLCDLCNGTKLKAVKSCLTCLVSYCETHLEPHRTVTGLTSHQLINPVENLEDRLCKEHHKPLELFCTVDQKCICLLCTVVDHKAHDVVPLKQVCEETKAQLDTKEAELQQMIQMRWQKIQEIQQSVELSNDDADAEMAGGVHVFHAMKTFLETHLKELIEKVEAKKSKTEKEAKGLITELQQEILELMKRSAVMKKLCSTQHDIVFLKSVLSISAAPPIKDWTQVSIPPPIYEGTVRKTVDRVTEELSSRFKEAHEELKSKLSQAELQKVQSYSVDVTLDPDSAHPDLIVSSDRKQVRLGNERKIFPKNPKRFSCWYNVLGNQSFSSGQFYFEVQVTGKIEWFVGVAKESVNRKQSTHLRIPQGYWALYSSYNTLYAQFEPPVTLSATSAYQRVGVFVDYDEGLVSFYDSCNGDHIHSFTGCLFTEPLYPVLSPHLKHNGRNPSPLIITPVSI